MSMISFARTCLHRRVVPLSHADRRRFSLYAAAPLLANRGDRNANSAAAIETQVPASRRVTR